MVKEEALAWLGLIFHALWITSGNNIPGTIRARYIERYPTRARRPNEEYSNGDVRRGAC